jgi:hypothetical protein
LQTSLDGDFQSCYQPRRYGSGIGPDKIDCEVCGYDPKHVTRGLSEDYWKYSYRKWRAVVIHMLWNHLRQQMLTHRRIVAKEKERNAAANNKVGVN